MITITSKQGVEQNENIFHPTHQSLFLDIHCQPCFDCNYELPPGMRMRNLLRNVLKTNYTEVHFYIIAIHILNSALLCKVPAVDTPIN